MKTNVLQRVLIAMVVILIAVAGYQQIRIDSLQHELETSQQRAKVQMEMAHQAQSEAAMQREIAIKMAQHAEELRLQAELSLKGK